MKKVSAVEIIGKDNCTIYSGPATSFDAGEFYTYITNVPDNQTVVVPREAILVMHIDFIDVEDEPEPERDYTGPLVKPKTDRNLN